MQLSPGEKDSSLGIGVYHEREAEKGRKMWHANCSTRHGGGCKTEIKVKAKGRARGTGPREAVSYTHLTLPTSDLV